MQNSIIYAGTTAAFDLFLFSQIYFGLFQQSKGHCIEFPNKLFHFSIEYYVLVNCVHMYKESLVYCVGYNSLV